MDNLSTLPEYLQQAIIEYEENKDNPREWDMYYDELYGSINAAQHGGDITFFEAEELRKRYL